MMTKLPVPQLLAWPLVLALAAVGCNSTDAGEVDPCLAFLRINLEVGDAVINEVYYEISGNGIEPREGTIDTSAPGSTASVEEFGLPPGEDYLVEMVARSVDGKLLCGGTAEFDVSVGPSTEVDVIMHCKGAEEFGGVRVNGELNICTELDKVVVKPLQTSSGYSLSVEAEASDQEDDSFAYSWTATGGSFDDPDAAKTIYTCGEPGEEVITIEVSDDDFEYCVDFWDVHVNCVDDNGAGGSGGSGSGGAGGSAGGGGTGGAAGGGGSGGAAGGAGGSAGGGGSAGNGGNGGSAGSAGSGGSAGSAGSGGSAGSAGNGGSSGGGGSGGSIPPECLVSLSVQ